MARDAVKNYLALASGLTEVTRQRAIAAAKALAASGEATAGQVSSIAEDLLATSRSNREALAAVIKLELDRTLGRLGLASAEEITALAARVQRMEAALREQAKPATTKAAGAAPTKAAPRKAAPRKAAPRKAAPGRRAPTAGGSAKA